MRKRYSLPLLLGLGILAPTALPPTLLAQTDTVGFTYDDWSDILDRFVDDQGLVDYQGLSQDRQGLDRFVDQVARLSPRSHPDLFPEKPEQLAYYINAYNALVFHGVLREGPNIKTVWGFGGVGYSFFAGAKYTVGGEGLSLKKLEDDWIRAGFKDPRIHAALNCASLGCPRLPRAPFLAEKLDEQLDAAMTEFVTQERNCLLEPKKRTVTLSKIFSWFEQDFLDYERAQGDSKPSIAAYLNRFRPESAQIPADFKVKTFKYDKGLNRQTLR